jgi:membrane associated rhomboid family serine protease
MDPGALVPCVTCGTPTPRAEMFGAAPDLRCGTCADRLRQRTDPRAVRRGPTAVFLAGRDPRATVALLATMVVLWVAWKFVPTLKTHLEDWIGMQQVPRGWLIDVRPDALAIALRSVLHINFWHLLMNGLALHQIGRWIELGWGPRAVLLLTLGGGIAGVAAGWLVNGAPTIGISGGIFTLEGWLLTLRRHHPVAAALVSRTFIHSLLASTLLLVVLTEVGGMPISHVAHAAGFLFGLLAGLAARSRAPFALYFALALIPLGLAHLCSEVAPLGLPLTLFGRR